MKLGERELKEEDIVDLLTPVPQGYYPTAYICWFDFKNYPNEGLSLIQRWDHMIKESIWVSIRKYGE